MLSAPSFPKSYIKRDKMQVECKICKSSFITTTSSKVCSEECKTKQTNIRNNKKTISKNKLSDIVECIECKTEFTRKHSSSKCCSDDCKKERIKKKARDKRKRHYNRVKDSMEYKDTVKKINSEYYIKNKDKISKVSKKYRIINREKLNKKKKEYYGSFSHSKKREYGAKQRLIHKERIKRYNEDNKYCLNQKSVIRNDISREIAYSHKSRWYKEDDILLSKLYYDRESHKLIAEALGRTISAIQSRQRRLIELGDLKERRKLV